MARVCLYAFLLFFFFFNDTATTEIYTLSLHDALPISAALKKNRDRKAPVTGKVIEVVAQYRPGLTSGVPWILGHGRSEEHTSELQSQSNIVCRLLLEKKKPIRRHASLRRCRHKHITHT